MDFQAKNETMILFCRKKILCARNRIDAISLFLRIFSKVQSESEKCRIFAARFWRTKNWVKTWYIQIFFVI